MFNLRANDKMQKLADENRVSPDGIEYRHMKWRHDSGSIVEINQDAWGVHARKDGGQAHVNLGREGLARLLARWFGL